MIRLLIFFVLLFGLFGVISAQYITQYREAYALWINKIVYGGKDEYKTCKEKIFSVWYELKCHNCKEKQYQDKLEPNRLYETYAEKIDNGEINSSLEERNLLKTLLKKEANLAWNNVALHKKEPRFKEAEKAYKDGKIKRGKLDDLWKDLNDWTQDKIELFVSDPYHPFLKTHRLSGILKGSWAIRINYEHRLVFKNMFKSAFEYKKTVQS